MEYLFTGEELEDGLERLKKFVRDWIEEDPSEGPAEDRMRHLSMTLFGPFPEERCVVERRTPEEQLALADSAEARFDLLGTVAKRRFEAGDFEAARRTIAELQALLPSFSDHWNYPAAVATVQIVLGRLALQEGDLVAAKQQLVEAGRSQGSPTMSSFGPNMSLAHDLLVAGERQTVLDYFEACRGFWNMGEDRLDIWAMYVNAGRIPDFGANLDY